ncbi:MAG: acyl-CoA carboxylase subunit beta [Candidatus Kapabacteria bacterium]|nr:acyl-CoA carboxylase subunit beta [Candidatus Kapabacteria bacterium]MDW8012205.1 acyl-CoA carboxylase subunit beta [Bacteroidota bacterium]
MARIGSEIPHDATYERNYDYNREQLRILQARAERIRQGGGPAAQERLRARGKLPARERIARLIDPGTSFLELGLFAAYGMYSEYGGCPAAGVIVGIGIIAGRECVIVANDASVKAGAWFPMTAKKNLRAQEIALDNRVPIIYLVDSAGVFLPLQDEVFPDKEHFGRQFRNNAILSSLGVPQIAAIMGPCVAGGAYLPIMSDEAIMVEGTGSLFLAGPALVEAAIGEKADIEELGGARMHASISGVVDHRVRNDEEAITLIRSLVAKISPAKGRKPIFDRTDPRPPAFDPEEILGILPADRTKPYDTYQLLARILDDSELDEYKAEYGKTIICGYGRIDGWAVGIVANQRAIVRSGRGELQIGGVIYSDSADKAARFIMNCNQRGIPLVFFQDVTGFMVGTRAEQGGIIKDGAKMVNAVANSVVPKITVIVGNSFGAGNYAMCGRAYDPRLIVAYPTARIGVMGGAQASRTLLTIRLENLKREGKTLSEEEQQALLREIEQRYEEQLSPYYAAARLWVDELISPLQTREYISRMLACAAHNDTLRPWSVGVLQT